MRQLRPWHIVLFIWITLGVLFTLGKLDDLGTLDNLGSLGSLDRLESPASLDTLDTFVPITSAQPMKIGHNAPLDRFFFALKTASTDPVRVVHFGDSQIEQDRISMTLRRYWQRQYGGSGLGLIPIMQTVPTYTLNQTLTMAGKPVLFTGGPQRYFVYGLRSLRREGNNRYGIMGQVTVMNDSLVAGSEQLRLTFKNRYAQDKEHTLIRLWADSTITMNVEDLHTISLSGKGDVYGLSLESKTGVHVDNIPMRGSAGTMFTNINKELLTDYFAKTNTKLIIMQYGGNALPNITNHSQVTETVNILARQVRYLQSCAPEADILFIGPSDMLINDHGEIRSDPLVPYMDIQLERMSVREEIAYFSTYRAMGGENAMLRWQEQGLAGEDGIHFTKRGADRIAEEIINYIEKLDQL